MAFQSDLSSGERAYNKTFKQKTGKAKGYTPIEMKLGAAKDTTIKPEISKSETELKYPESKLEKPV